jgi:3-hydroxyisobutyrate dehydrogenase-like beta-hydroxyacid dehydrogenase
MSETLGFIGLGNMGEAIAANLIQAGYALKVYNRTASKAEPLVAKGATEVKNPADVASPGGIVLTMVSDDRAIEEIADAQGSFVERLGAGGIHVSFSTISPATASCLSINHARHKVAYVAAPVFGRPDAAAARKLWVCTSGPAAAKQRIRPVLEAISQGIFDFGEEPAAANIVKVCGNFMIASAIEALAEALTLAEKNGLARRDVAEFFGKTVFSCGLYQNYGKTIAEQKFEPAGFRLRLGMKDVDLAVQTAAASSMPMPFASLLHDRFVTSVARGRGNWDWTGIAVNSSEDAGLQ